MAKTVETKQAEPRERKMPKTRSQQEDYLTYYDHGQQWLASGERRFRDYFGPACSITMAAAEFACAVQRVAPSCAAGNHIDGGLGPTGILTDFRQSGEARLVATDLRRCALQDVCTEADTGKLPPSEGILQTATLREAARSATETGVEVVEIKLSEDGQVQIHAGGEVVTGTSIVAAYPKYRRGWPEGFEREFRVPSEPLADVLRLLGPKVRREDHPRVDLTFSGKTLEMSVVDKKHKSGEMRERLAAEVRRGDDEKFHVSFNPTELLDGIEAIGAEEVAFEMNEPLKPVQITAAIEDGVEPRFRYLLAPEAGPSDG